nr:gypsy/Ty3 retroelement polyprotein [Tanacetum cinerariifolium]
MGSLLMDSPVRRADPCVLEELYLRMKDNYKDGSHRIDIFSLLFLNRTTHNSKYTWSANELRRKEKLVVDNDEAVRLRLIAHFYSSAVGGHFGVDISLDFIEALPVSQGKIVIMVVVDRLSKYANFIPLSHPFTIAQVAQAFLDTSTSLMACLLLLQLTIWINKQHKLSAKFYRLFKVLERIRNVAYKLDIPPAAQVHLVFHVSQLKKCHSIDVSMGTFPLCDAQGLIAVTPHKLLDRKLTKQGNRAVVYGLIQWSNSSEEDAN